MKFDSLKWERRLKGWWWLLLGRLANAEEGMARGYELESEELEAGCGGEIPDSVMAKIAENEQIAREHRKASADWYKMIPHDQRDWVNKRLASTSKIVVDA